MPLARVLNVDSLDALALAFRRLGLPRPAREYLAEKLPYAQLLLTGLERDDARFLRQASEAWEGAAGPQELPTYVAGDAVARPGTALLSGRKEQHERLTQRAQEAGRPALATALSEALAALDASAGRVLEAGRHRLALGERTRVMGVLNVTPDSFSDGGRFLAPKDAVAQGEALVKAGADLLDVGGESTRPGAPEVTVEEELARVLPVVKALAARVDVPLSIDTRKPEVAEAALAAGACLVNDVTGFLGDARLAQVAAAAGAACCLMHLQGTPQTMQQAPSYGDVVEEVVAYLRQGVERALAAGIPRQRILVDPGIGFGKTAGHNLFLLRRLPELRVLGLPILVGTSRKSFLGQLAGGKPPGERLAATLGSIAALAVMGGADVVRVHDVTEAKDALAVADALRSAQEGGTLWAPTSPRGP